MRWLWPSTAEFYPALLRAGVAVARCHDLELSRGAPARRRGPLGRATRARGQLGPAHRGPGAARSTARTQAPPGDEQDALFDPPLAPPAAAGFDALTATARGVRGPARPHRSHRTSGPVPAARRGRVGRWRCWPPRWGTTACRGARQVTTSCCSTCSASRHRSAGHRSKLAALAEEISAAFGGVRLRPDSPAEVLRAFHRAGYPVTSTRAWELRGIDHPAVPLLRRYKELYRIWTAHGWAWRQTWVRDGRFHAGVRPGRRRVRPLGDPGRRRAADPEGAPRRGPGRSRLAAGRRRRRPARTADPRRGLRRRRA